MIGAKLKIPWQPWNEDGICPALVYFLHPLPILSEVKFFKKMQISRYFPYHILKYFIG